MANNKTKTQTKENMKISEFKAIKENGKIIINGIVYICTRVSSIIDSKNFRLENGKKSNWTMCINKPSQTVRFFHIRTNEQLI